MPKIKTHRGAAKRFDVTKSGKIKRRTCQRSRPIAALLSVLT